MPEFSSLDWEYKSRFPPIIKYSNFPLSSTVLDQKPQQSWCGPWLPGGLEEKQCHSNLVLLQWSLASLGGSSRLRLPSADAEKGSKGRELPLPELLLCTSLCWTLQPRYVIYSFPVPWGAVIITYIWKMWDLGFREINFVYGYAIRKQHNQYLKAWSRTTPYLVWAEQWPFLPNPPQIHMLKF